MNEDRHERTRLLWPDQAIETLRGKTVVIAGLGGVGSWAVEGLARAGIGRLVLIDFDIITPSNLNRQLFALESTIGQPKCEVAAGRIRDIDHTIEVTCIQERLEPGKTAALLDRCPPADYLVDAIDSISAKVDLITTACRLHIPVISCMGTGNRLDPSRLRVTDLAHTQGDPLARRVRQQLRKAGIEAIKVLFSDEPPRQPKGASHRVGSTPIVPPVAGLLIACEVIGDLALREAAGPMRRLQSRRRSQEQ